MRVSNQDTQTYKNNTHNLGDDAAGTNSKAGQHGQGHANVLVGRVRHCRLRSTWERAGVSKTSAKRTKIKRRRLEFTGKCGVLRRAQTTVRRKSFEVKSGCLRDPQAVRGCSLPVDEEFRS